MSDWSLVTSTCTTRGCQMIYRSADDQIGLWITSSSGKTRDRRVYFIWDKPDSALDYATEAEARAALQARQAQAPVTTEE